MRSAPPGPSGLLPALAGLVDQSTAHRPGHVLVHVEGPIGPDIAFALQPVGDVHPFEALAGFTAPETWSCFGVRATGRAHHLDGHGPPPARSAVTLLVDRGGAEASVLRRGSVVTDLPGPAAGTIPDLCRRVLGLPTPPAPASTAALWTAAWLDRVLDAWGRPERRRELEQSWGQVAVLHPAIAEPTSADLDAVADPAALVALATAHAATRPWSRLRHASPPFRFPGGPLPPSVATWMDDGFFSRWVLGAYPSIATMTHDLRALLDRQVGRRLSQVVEALQD